MRYRQRAREVQPLLVLLTDGRANAATSGSDPLADAITRAAALRTARVPSLVVDTEQGALRLGLARRLAEALGGVCLRLEELAAGTLARAASCRWPACLDTATLAQNSTPFCAFTPAR